MNAHPATSWPAPAAWASATDIEAVYARVCESYHAIDDFRMKLLRLLPVATGAGVFLLLSGKADLLGTHAAVDVRAAMAAIGAVGVLFTLGLFAFELFGIKKCHYLIEAGRRLERDIGVCGQFRARPFDAAGFLNEPIASSVIYPSSLAACVFLGLCFFSVPVAGAVAGLVFASGCALTVHGSRQIPLTYAGEQLILRSLRDEPAGLTAAALAARARRDRDWVDGALARLEDRGDVERVGAAYCIARRRYGASALDAPAEGWLTETPATPTTPPDPPATAARPA